MGLSNFKKDSFIIKKIFLACSKVESCIHDIFVYSLVFLWVDFFKQRLIYVFKQSFIYNFFITSKKAKKNNFLSTSKFYIQLLQVKGYIQRGINNQKGDSLFFCTVEEMGSKFDLRPLRVIGAFLVTAILTNTLFSTIILKDRLTNFGYLMRLISLLYGFICFFYDIRLKDLRESSFVLGRIFAQSNPTEGQK